MTKIRLGAALFNGDHGRLAEELESVVEAGVDFLHLDVFDGQLIPDLGFSARTIHDLRRLTRLPFEVHLGVADPSRHLPALASAGVDRVFLPVESSSLLYEGVYAARELGMEVGLCLALATPLTAIEEALRMVDAVLLLARVMGEGARGRTFNPLVLERTRRLVRMLEAIDHPIDVQVAGGLEPEWCQRAVEAGATSLPLGGTLFRQADRADFLARLRRQLGEPEAELPTGAPSRGHLVVVASRSFGKSAPAAVELLRARGCEVRLNPLDRAPTEEELRGWIAEADLLISGTEPVTESVLEAAPRLRGIAKHGTGVDNIDLEAARRRGIPVAVVAEAATDSVADLTLGLMLALARRIPESDRLVRGGGWGRPVGIILRGKLLGLVGLGRIGRAVARRARAFGMRLIAFDEVHDQAWAAAWGISYVELDDLLAQADVVTLHLPLTEATRDLIDARRLALMKPSAFLVNTSRGELVDEDALAQALREGRLAGAASDVFRREPPGENPLLGLESFVATPHCGAQTLEALATMDRVTAENAILMLSGREPRGRVA